MLSWLLKKLRELKDKNADLNWGREIIVQSVVDFTSHSQLDTFVILDVGVGQGDDLQNIVHQLPMVHFKLHGIENHPEYIQSAREKGITVSNIDIERDQFQYPDGSVDIVIINQVLEHTKEVFWIISEISRVLKPGGLLIVGVPNLAALHNRLALLLGLQPACIQLLSGHIRGYTRKALRDFIITDNYFSYQSMSGSNFYPFPRDMAKLLGTVFPSLAVGIFLTVTRTDKPGTYLKILERYTFETPYYHGPE